MHRHPQFRDSWAEIDLGAIAFNVKQLKKRLDAGTLFMAVVKADGYGHGAVPVARAALAAGADWCGVATVAEAIELRAAGIEAPILLMTQPPKSALDAIIDLEITSVAASPEFVYELAGAAQLVGKVADYHLKINTGMNRLGIRPGQAAALLRELRALVHVNLNGVCTHFASSEVEGDGSVANQLKQFNDTLDTIRASGIDPGIVHAANSGATILVPESHFDMVRCGIAMYGLHPGDDTKAYVTLKPAMSVYSNAILTSNVALGEGVGYGLTWRAEIPCAVITLPIGYADGVPRTASGKLEFLHDGRRFDQIGRVCMDLLLVRGLQNDRIATGETFVMIGEDGGDAISLDEVAAKADTISYEIACGLGRRLDRIYI
jgi:alanine racemase